jgi:hypothetical protein
LVYNGTFGMINSSTETSRPVSFRNAFTFIRAVSRFRFAISLGLHNLVKERQWDERIVEAAKEEK